MFTQSRAKATDHRAARDRREAPAHQAARIHRAAQARQETRARPTRMIKGILTAMKKNTSTKKAKKRETLQS